MKLIFGREAWADYLVWQREAPKVLARINALIEECRRHPFTGTGKPEPLRRTLTGWWSRRITGVHRLVYRVSRSDEAQALEVLSCRFQASLIRAIAFSNFRRNCLKYNGDVQGSLKWTG